MTHRSRSSPRAHLPALALAGALAAIGCGGGSEAEGTETAALTVNVSDLAVVDSSTIETGPLVSGSLEAREQATVRAEVGGTVTDLRVEEGERVSRGDVLLALDTQAPAGTLESARAQVTSLEEQVEVARRDVDRYQRLVDVGAVSEQQLETARNQLATLQAQLADARARRTEAGERVADTRPVAPLGGVVSQRPVNGGDVVSVGEPLVTIVDPSNLRLVASVPADALSQLEVGAPVQFEVSGFPDETFNGSVTRINPVADPATRQVTLYVDIPNADGRLLAGLFAEGRVATKRHRTLVIPAGATDLTAEAAASAGGSVLRLREGRAERVRVTFGLVDPRTDRLEVLEGVQAGDTVLVGPAREITPDTPVQVAAAPDSTAGG